MLMIDTLKSCSISSCLIWSIIIPFLLLLSSFEISLDIFLSRIWSSSQLLSKICALFLDSLFNLLFFFMILDVFEGKHVPIRHLPSLRSIIAMSKHGTWVYTITVRDLPDPSMWPKINGWLFRSSSADFFIGFIVRSSSRVFNAFPSILGIISIFVLLCSLLLIIAIITVVLFANAFYCLQNLVWII